MIERSRAQELTRGSRRCVAIVVLGTLAASFAFASATAQESLVSSPLDADQRLAHARHLIDNRQNEEAIALLPSLLDSLRSDPDRLERTYLLLIEAYVLHANGQDREEVAIRDALMKQASDLVHACLSTPSLRHTQPDSLSPLEMVTLFASTRLEIFGRVTITVVPLDTEAILDGERLEGKDGIFAAENVPSGLRTLQLRHPDRKILTEYLPIAPGEHLIREFQLDKRRGLGWYATRVVLPLGVAGTLTWVLADGSGERPPQEPVLDGTPPGPP